MKSTEHFKTKCYKAIKLFCFKFLYLLLEKGQSSRTKLALRRLVPLMDFEALFAGCLLIVHFAIDFSQLILVHSMFVLSTTLPRTVHVWNGPRNDD